MRILAVLGFEVMACVTILARITRRPPACGARLHTGREAPKSSKGEMRAGPPAERSLRGIARNVTGWPASRQARIFMKIELNSIKNCLSTGPRAGRARFRLLLAGNGPRLYGARRSERWWERAEGKQVVVVVGEGTEKKSRHKKYSHGTVGSMSTVVQDLHGGRHALPAGDTRRSDIDSNVDCESDLKKNRLLLLFVKSEKQFCSQKNTATIQWAPSIKLESVESCALNRFMAVR